MSRVALLVLLLLFMKVVPAVAQELSPPERAREDYLFQYAKYSEAHQAYRTAKEAYLRFGTIAAQQEAITKTKEVLSLRAEVLRTYLQLVKIILIGQRELDGTLRNAQVGKIEATQSFLETHKENIARIATTFEVNAESGRLEREAQALEDLAYESLSFILIGQVQGLETRTRLLLEQTVALAGEDNQAIVQGAGDARRKLTTVRVAIDRATESVLTVKSRRVGKFASAFAEVKKVLVGALPDLKEASNLVQEMLRNLERHGNTN